MKSLLFFMLVLYFSACQSIKKINSSPLITVVKLISAERDLNFEEAKKYQDIDQVYKRDSAGNRENKWRDMLIWQNNMANSKKITNQFKYYDYEIIEETGEKTSKIKFVPKKKSNFKAIIYALSLTKTGWVVNSIEYNIN